MPTLQGPPCVYVCKKRSHTHVKDPVVYAGVRWIMETPEFGGLRKQLNSLACAKSVRLRRVEAGHYTKEQRDGITQFKV